MVLVIEDGLKYMYNKKNEQRVKVWRIFIIS